MAVYLVLRQAVAVDLARKGDDVAGLEAADTGGFKLLVVGGRLYAVRQLLHLAAVGGGSVSDGFIILLQRYQAKLVQHRRALLAVLALELKGQAHPREVEPAVGARTAEDEVGQAADAQHRRLLLAENEVDGVKHVALARSVGPDHAEQHVPGLNGRGRGEALEAVQLNFG